MAKPQAIKAGYYVAISLEPETAPEACYVGLVGATDEYGIRINLVHWDDELDVISGKSEDLFVPWTSITSILVCNEEQPMRRFIRDTAPAWKADIESMYTAD